MKYPLPEFVSYKLPLPDHFTKETKLTFIDSRHGEFVSRVQIMHNKGYSMHPVEIHKRKMIQIENLSSPKIRKKAQYTMLERYGSSHALQNKDIFKKSRDTLRKNFGYDHPGCNPEFIKKAKNTMKERYGVSHAKRQDKHCNTLPNGKTISEYASELNINKTKWNRLVHDGVSLDIVEADMTGHKSITKTGLEHTAESLLSEFGFVFHNKKLFQDRNYRPDFIHIEAKIAIDVDGLFVHSEKSPNYHKEKNDYYTSQGWKLLQFHEDEIKYKKDIVKSIVSSKLNFGNHKQFYARKLEIKSVKEKEATEFFNSCHLMGGSAKGTKVIGLFEGDNVISLLSYKKHKTGVDIVRFCNKLNTSVAGGLSKLLKYIERLEKPAYIQSYVDLRYGDGESLHIVGYTKETTHVGFKWTDGSKTFNRLHCRANMDDRKLTEREYAILLKLHKLYDAGQAKFVKYFH